MEKTITIDGMSCAKCSERVEKALNALPGVSATVNLQAKTASVRCQGNIGVQALRQAVSQAGYQVVGEIV